MWLTNNIQTVLYSFHSSLEINGGIKISENPEEELTTWQWNIVKPTKLRLYDHYAKVGFSWVGNFFNYRFLYFLVFIFSMLLGIEQGSLYDVIFLILDLQCPLHPHQPHSLHPLGHPKLVHLCHHQKENISSSTNFSERTQRHLCCYHPYPHCHGLCCLQQYQGLHQYSWAVLYLVR